MVRPAVVHEEHLDLGRVLGVGMGEAIKESLQAVAVGGGQFEREGVARVGLDGPAQPEALEGLLEGTNRLHAWQGEPAALDGVEAKAALILGPQADAPAGMGGLHGTEHLA